MSEMLPRTFQAMKYRQAKDSKRRSALLELKGRIEANSIGIEQGAHNAAMMRIGEVLGTSHPALYYQEACALAAEEWRRA